MVPRSHSTSGVCLLYPFVLPKTPSKSTPAHDAVVAALLHRHYPRWSGPHLAVYGSPLLLTATATYDKSLFSPSFRWKNVCGLCVLPCRGLEYFMLSVCIFFMLFYFRYFDSRAFHAIVSWYANGARINYCIFPGSPVGCACGVADIPAVKYVCLRACVCVCLHRRNLTLYRLTFPTLNSYLSHQFIKKKILGWFIQNELHTTYIGQTTIQDPIR